MQLKLVIADRNMTLLQIQLQRTNQDILLGDPSVKKVGYATGWL